MYDVIFALLFIELFWSFVLYGIGIVFYRHFRNFRLHRSCWPRRVAVIYEYNAKVVIKALYYFLWHLLLLTVFFYKVCDYRVSTIQTPDTFKIWLFLKIGQKLHFKKFFILIHPEGFAARLRQQDYFLNFYREAQDAYLPLRI